MPSIPEILSDIVTEFPVLVFVALTMAGAYLLWNVILRSSDAQRARRFQTVADRLGLVLSDERGLTLRGELDGLGVKVAWNRRRRGTADEDGGPDGNTGPKSGVIMKVYFPQPIDTRSPEVRSFASRVRERNLGLRIQSDGIRLAAPRLDRSVSGLIATVKRQVSMAQKLIEVTAQGPGADEERARG